MPLTPELLAGVKKALAAGRTPAEIEQEMLANGWSRADAAVAFRQLGIIANSSVGIRRSRWPFVVIVVVLLLAGVAAGGWWLWQKQKTNPPGAIVKESILPPPVIEEPTPPPSAEEMREMAESAAWRSYENRQLNFRFQYPADWALQERSKPDGAVIGLKSNDYVAQGVGNVQTGGILVFLIERSSSFKDINHLELTLKLAQQYGEQSLPHLTRTKISGYPALKGSGYVQNSSTEHISILVESYGRWFTIDFIYQKNNPQLKQIFEQ